MNAKRNLILSALAGCVLLVGCGKNESEKGATGTILGAATGALVTNKKHRGTGMVVGGLIGNMAGRLAGAKEDQKKDRRRHERHITALAVENQDLRRVQERWCGTCVRRVSLRGARCCPTCGSELITEKICRRCATVYSPGTGYRYCPYCKDRVLLTSR